MKFISYSTDPEGYVDITVPPAMSAEFKIMVQRACSTWQDISPDMRHFADRVLGVAAIAGDNMKAGHENSYVRPIANAVLAARTRECCHTLLTEPHHTQCPEKDKVAPYVKHLCNGHPETCNCPRHCR